MTVIVSLLSGGMDSTTLLAVVKADYPDATVKALSVDYGQRHRRELEFAKVQAEIYGVEHRVADLSSITSILAGSALTSSDIAVPKGHYADETMKATVVPNRNMLMLSVAAAWGISLAKGEGQSVRVAYAAHAGDHAIYPDCRPEFAYAIDDVLRLVDWQPVTLFAPFLHRTKADIALVGTTLGVDFSKTWSCYVGGSVHCGTCGTCVERRESFALAGVTDPTIYTEEISFAR